MAALRMARYREPPFPVRWDAWVGCEYAVSQPAVLLSQAILVWPVRPTYPGSARRLPNGPVLASPSGPCQPPVQRRRVSFPSGPAAVSSVTPTTRSGAPTFISVQVSALRADHCLEPQQQAQPSKLAAVPVNRGNTPPRPRTAGRPLLGSSPPNSARRGILMLHVNPRPRSAGQRPCQAAALRRFT